MFDLYSEKNTWKRCLVTKLLLCFRKMGSLNIMAMSELYSWSSEIAISAHAQFKIFKFGQNTDSCSQFPKYPFQKKIAKSPITQLRTARWCWKKLKQMLKVETMTHYMALVIKARNDWRDVGWHPSCNASQLPPFSSFSTSINKSKCKKQNNNVVILSISQV